MDRPPFDLKRYWTPKITLAALIVAATLLLILAIWWRRPGTSTAPTATPTIPRDLAPEAVSERAFPSLTYGVHTFLWWNETARAYDLEMVRLMDFTHVKQRMSWRDMEPLEGEWHFEYADAVVDAVENQDLNLVARLDGPPDWALVAASDDPAQPPINLDAWGEFCSTVAARYQGRIAAYQIWNEPNLDHEWNRQPPNAEGYVRLLRACSEAIRAVDPGVIIISAGLAPTGGPLPGAVPDVDYLRAMYDAGAAPWFDVLGLNAPGYKAPPTLSPDDAAAKYGHRWMCFRHVEDMRGIMVEEGDGAKQIALLEVGWTLDDREGSPYAWHAVSEKKQAKYLVGAYRYAAQNWRPWVGLVVTIYMSDISWTPDNEEYWWAINTPGYPPINRQAYFDLANMEKVSDDRVTPARDPSAPDSVVAPTLEPRQDDQ